MLRAKPSNQSGIWGGLAIGTSHAVSLPMLSNFTVLVLRTHTQGELGLGIRQDLVLVVFLSSVWLLSLSVALLSAIIFCNLILVDVLLRQIFIPLSACELPLLHRHYLTTYFIMLFVSLFMGIQ